LQKKIAKKTGIETIDVQAMLEAFCSIVKETVKQGEAVDIRGFGRFSQQKRAQKLARNITQNTALMIPAHSIPKFKPAKIFIDTVKQQTTLPLITK